jgi:hypothetical protein
VTIFIRRPDVSDLIFKIAERNIPTLGPISNRFVEEAWTLAHELLTQSDDTIVGTRVRELVTERYPRLSQNRRDVVADDIIVAVISCRERARRS